MDRIDVQILKREISGLESYIERLQKTLATHKEKVVNLKSDIKSARKDLKILEGTLEKLLLEE